MNPRVDHRFILESNFLKARLCIGFIHIHIFMPKNYLKFQFVPSNNTGYVMDIGNVIAASGGGYLPPDISNTVVDDILDAAGAQLTAEIQDNLPCTDSINAKLRRLVFVRDNGNSMSVPVGDRADLLSAATTIKAILDAGEATVVCIKLVGERFANLADELGLTYAGTFATSHVPTTGGKQYVYSGAASYQTDAVRTALGDDTVFQVIRSVTNNENAPSTQLNAAWAGCVGDFQDAIACRGQGRTNPRKHRRYELTFFTKADPTDDNEAARTETAELPVVGATAAEILTCGTSATNLTGLYCIGYRGEDYARFHKILP